MKHIQQIKNVIIPALLVLPFFVWGHKGKERKPSAKACLEISGQVNQANNNTVSVYLIEENTLIDSLEVDGMQIFSFSLEKNRYYSIRIKQAGYVPRLVSVSTWLPCGLKEEKPYKFHFDLLQLSEEELSEEQADLLDFPIALVCFDKQKGYFDYNADYTSRIKNAYQVLKPVARPYLSAN